MVLSLSVPIVVKPLPKEIETNPKKARAWVEGLPLTRIVESSRILIQHLDALNRAKMPAEERLVLVEIYRLVTDVLLEELEATYAASMLPMSAKQQEAFDLAYELRTECGYAYKLLVLEKTSKLIAFGNKKTLPAPLHRTMALLLATMLQAYKTYHPVKSGVWAEANNIFAYAEEQGFVDEIGDEQSKTTIADLYHRMLMLALADPFRLMSREADKVLEILRQHRGLVDIRKSSDGLNPQRTFSIALDADLPPKALIQGNRPASGNHVRLIDATRLVDRLQQRIKSGDRSLQDNGDLVGRLLRLWGDPPRRQSRRNPADTGVALCAGIKAIAHFSDLADSEALEIEASVAHGRTVPLLKIPQDPMSQLIGVEECRVLNQSSNGLRLHRRHSGNVNITVGEAVGVRFIGGRAWNVGIVRWLTLLEDNSFEFGVELISPAAISVTVEPTIGTSARAMPAIMLVASHPDTSPDTLVASPDTFADLREFEVTEKGGLMNVRATTLIERTTRFDLFQFQPSIS